MSQLEKNLYKRVTVSPAYNSQQLLVEHTEGFLQLLILKAFSYYDFELIKQDLN